MATRGQSPVDIPASAPVHPPDMAFQYRPGPITLVDNLWAAQTSWPPGSAAAIDGVRHELLQFHVHHPSEHAFQGAPSDGELHLVHQASDGATAVVAVRLTIGAPCLALEALVSVLAGVPGSDLVDPTDLLPADRRYVAYTGSLTIPPYTEGVSWRIMLQPVQVAARQLEVFAAAYPGNARPRQPLGSRTFV